MDLKELQASINKKCKGVHCSVFRNSEIAEINEWIPSPSYDFNRILSGNLFKGLPEKSLTLLVGTQHSFKSSFMILCAVEAQKKGYTPVIFDTEGSLSKIFVERWGLDLDNALYVYTPYVDEIKAVLAKLKESGDERFAIVLDSVGGLEQEKSYEDALKNDVKSDMGGLARKIKSTMKLLINVCKGQNSIGLICSHFYGASGMIPQPDGITGGKAVLYLPDIIVSLRNKQVKNDNKEITGNQVKIVTLKNRFYPTGNEGTLEIDYQNGINRYSGIIDLAINAGLLEKNGAWYVNNETGEKFQGSDKALQCIDENLLTKINEWLEKTGYSTINKNVQEANVLLEEPENKEEEEE